MGVYTYMHLKALVFVNVCACSLVCEGTCIPHGMCGRQRTTSGDIPLLKFCWRQTVSHCLPLCCVPQSSWPVSVKASSCFCRMPLLQTHAPAFSACIASENVNSGCQGEPPALPRFLDWRGVLPWSSDWPPTLQELRLALSLLSLLSVGATARGHHAQTCMCFKWLHITDGGQTCSMSSLIMTLLFNAQFAV